MVLCITRKYRYMEAKLAQRKAAVEAKIPDIRKTLTMVEFLKDQRVCPVSMLRAQMLKKESMHTGREDGRSAPLGHGLQKH